MLINTKKFFKFVFIVLFFAIFSTLIYTNLILKPSLNRNWTEDQQLLATSIIDESGNIEINNIRNINYKSTSDYEVSYYDKKLNLNDIERAWFIVEPFGNFGAAHTFVSFETKQGEFISVSAEIRKEVGEKFSPTKGLFGRYELVYVIADERDVLRLRTNYRKDKVYLYPVNSTPEKIQAVFLDMLKRANELSQNPEFYNTLANNCTTNIAQHARKFSDKDIPWWDLRYLFPETVDSLALEVGLIESDQNIEETRKKYYVTEIAQKLDTDPDFSRKIRQAIR